jgi:hypothetical protein
VGARCGVDVVYAHRARILALTSRLAGLGFPLVTLSDSFELNGTRKLSHERTPKQKGIKDRQGPYLQRVRLFCFRV